MIGIAILNARNICLFIFEYLVHRTHGVRIVGHGRRCRGLEVWTSVSATSPVPDGAYIDRWMRRVVDERGNIVT